MPINVRPEPFDAGGELPAWFDDLGGRPLVYVTLGTVMNGNIPLFRLIADALADQPFDVVIALGDGIPREALGEVAGNIRVGGFLPQARILERASVVVNHGGYGTVSAALGAGLPLFLLPMGADQPYNTERCITAGAALGVIQDQPPGPPSAGPPPFTAPDPQVIRDGTRRLLEEPAFRDAARGDRGRDRRAAACRASRPAPRSRPCSSARRRGSTDPARRSARRALPCRSSPNEPGGDLGAVVQAKLVHHVEHVVLGGPDRQAQPGRDLLVRQALGDQADDLQLAIGQRASPASELRERGCDGCLERLHPQLCCASRRRLEHRARALPVTGQAAAQERPRPVQAGLGNLGASAGLQVAPHGPGEVGLDSIPVAHEGRHLTEVATHAAQRRGLPRGRRAELIRERFESRIDRAARHLVDPAPRRPWRTRRGSGPGDRYR